MKKQITKSQAKKANATQLVVLLIIGIVVLVISGVLLLFETAELIYGIALFGLLFGICFIIAGKLNVCFFSTMVYIPIRYIDAFIKRIAFT